MELGKNDPVDLAELLKQLQLVTGKTHIFFIQHTTNPFGHLPVTDFHRR